MHITYPGRPWRLFNAVDLEQPSVRSEEYLCRLSRKGTIQDYIGQPVVRRTPWVTAVPLISSVHRRRRGERGRGLQNRLLNVRRLSISADFAANWPNVRPPARRSQRSANSRNLGACSSSTETNSSALRARSHQKSGKSAIRESGTRSPTSDVPRLAAVRSISALHHATGRISCRRFSGQWARILRHQAWAHKANASGCFYSQRRFVRLVDLQEW